MGVNMYNSEGYYDPTAYEALMTIEKEAKALRAFRPVVYICSPLAGNVEHNQEKARTYCRFAVGSGCVPIAPHIYFTQFMNDASRKERDLALFMDIVLLSKCAELWVFGDTVTNAKELTADGIPTPAGKQRWQTSTVESILKNEKYKGAALLQKCFTVDFLTKKKKVNEGEVPQYYVEHSH